MHTPAYPTVQPNLTSPSPSCQYPIKKIDTAPKLQLSLPIQAVQCAAKFYWVKNTPKVLSIEDLLIIVLYFLLKPVEYSMTYSCASNHTVQFRRRDIRFFKKGTVVPHDSPLEKLRESNSARLYLYNQNNVQRVSTIHHYAVPQDFCPVKYLTTRTRHLYSIAPEDASLPIIYIDNTKHVTTSDITLEFR